MMLTKMLSCWMTWEAVSHIASACKQVLLDPQTEEGTMREAPVVVITVAVTPVVVQGVEDFLDRGDTSIDNPTFTFLTLNTAATEETEFPLRKLATYSDT